MKRLALPVRLHDIPSSASEASQEYGPTAYDDELEDKPPQTDSVRTKMLQKMLFDNGAKEDALFDDFGGDLPVSRLIQIAQVYPIWNKLSDAQKELFLSTEGTLPNGRDYKSRMVRSTPYVKPKRTLIHAVDGDYRFY